MDAAHVKVDNLSGLVIRRQSNRTGLWHEFVGGSGQDNGGERQTGLLVVFLGYGVNRSE